MKMNNSRPQLFSRATLKLTLFYTVIILVISLCFSLAIGTTAIKGSEHSFDRPPSQLVFSDGTQMDFKPAFQTHNQEIAQDIFSDLILINLGVLILGAGLSFWLARWTLSPIEKAMNKQNDFVANASHELKTPLAVIQTENEVALREKKPTNNELRETLQNNLAEIKKLRSLTDYLLAINSAEASRIELRENDLIDIMQNAISRIAKKADQKKIKISREVAPIKIITDADSLAEIIYILLENAVKYSPENSQISLIANSREISVSDQGDGIAKADTDRIFERFYRSEKSHTSEGFGLGLSLAKDLSMKIRAKLDVQNLTERGHVVGAKFTIKF